MESLNRYSKGAGETMSHSRHSKASVGTDRKKGYDSQ